MGKPNPEKGVKMKRMVLIIYATISILSVYPVFAGEKKLTIVHSNDLHSHFLGAAPNIDYTPGITGDDDTLGGWARIATIIKEVKSSRSNPVLVLDAGDFLMGSLFHLFGREEAFELRLMKEMGYDMVALGNHEFDLKPVGLARILATANENNAMPPLVCANAVFSKKDDADNTHNKFVRDSYSHPSTPSILSINLKQPLKGKAPPRVT